MPLSFSFCDYVGSVKIPSKCLFISSMHIFLSPSSTTTTLRDENTSHAKNCQPCIKFTKMLTGSFCAHANFLSLNFYFTNIFAQHCVELFHWRLEFTPNFCAVYCMLYAGGLRPFYVCVLPSRINETHLPHSER